MRLITHLTGALLIAGMAACVGSPRAAAEPISGTALAAQQDQTAPPKQDQTKPRKPAKQPRPAKAPKADRNQTKPKPEKADRDQMNQQQKADHRQQNQPENANRHQQKEETRQPEHAQNGRNQPGGAHGRIADHDYRAHFGREHHFAVRRFVTTTRIVPNQTRFVYGGYTFIFLDPWPSDWAMSDDCYIDYEDGEYVLIDLAHPGVTIALEIGG